MTDWQQGLRAAVRLSRKSLDKIGEGVWTPQDTAHWQLVRTVEEFLRASNGQEQDASDSKASEDK